MTQTLGDIIALHNVIAQIMQDRRPRPVKFAYALAKNKRNILPSIEAFNEALAAESPAMKSFGAARQALLKEHAILDAQGKPMIAGAQPAIRDREAFETATAALREAHPEATAEMREREALAMQMMREPVDDVLLHKIPLSELPTEIEPVVLEALLPMVREHDAP